MNYRTPRPSRTRRPSYILLASLVTGLVVAVAAPAWGQVINEEVKFIAIDGATEDLFGQSIDIDNGIVAVGAHYDDDKGAFSGSAYLFDAATGDQLFKLVPDDGASNDQFGWSIAIDDGVVAIGAFQDGDNGLFAGSAYLFDATTGLQLFKLLPSDGGASDHFGWSIAIDNGVVVVGARSDRDNGSYVGSAYLFNAATGEQINKLLPNDAPIFNHFAYSVAIDNGIVAIGAYRDDENGPASGSAYLFDAATGDQLLKLLPSDGASGDEFGNSIAIDRSNGNGVVAVGAHYNRDNGSTTGSAYLFDATTGAEITKLLPNDSAEGDNFGWSIAVENGVVVVGARFDDDNSKDSGSAYLFNASNGEEIAKLLNSDGTNEDHFGNSVAINKGFIAAGARQDDDNGYNSGSAYLFDANSILHCLNLVVENLIAGQRAVLTILGGTTGAKGVTVYGTQPGQTSVNNYASYCATFGIKGVNQNKVIGGLNRIFDGDGKITFTQLIPGGASGMRLFFQSARARNVPG